ncbi:hypothetical protein Slu03_08470 [Sediminihabitans luteus]|nr:hypothetical protein Slu03_08470 [Sediminihabitans luteus]
MRPSTAADTSGAAESRSVVAGVVVAAASPAGLVVVSDGAGVVVLSGAVASVARGPVVSGVLGMAFSSWDGTW